VVKDVAFSPDGRTIVGSFENEGRTTGHINLWNEATRQLTGALPDADGDNAISLGDVAFNPKNARSAAVADGNRVDLWNPGASTIRRVSDPEGRLVSAVAYTPDGKTLVEGNVAGDIYLLNVATGRWSTRLFRDSIVYRSQSGSNTQFLGQVAVSPTGKTAAVIDSTGNVYLLNLSGGSPVLVKGAAEASQALAFSPDGKTLAIVDRRDVRLWDVATGNFSATLTGSGTTPAAAAFSPNGTTLAVADANGNVYLWDLATSHETAIATPTNYLSGLAFSPDGTTLAAYSNDDTKIYLYSIKYSAS